jgi:hypothetical protein
VYIPPSLRLKDPALIERWERLAVYARAVPPRPAIMRYTNSLHPEWVLTGHRAKGMASAIFFTRGEAHDFDAFDEVEAGGEFHSVTTEYKVSERTPFVIRRVDATHLRVTEDGDDLELASNQKQGLVGLLRSTLGAQKAGLLKPDAQELDELLAFLEHASADVEEGVLGP